MRRMPPYRGSRLDGGTSDPAGAGDSAGGQVDPRDCAPVACPISASSGAWASPSGLPWGRAVCPALGLFGLFQVTQEPGSLTGGQPRGLWARGGVPSPGCKGAAWAGPARHLPPPGRPVPAPAAPTEPRASVWRRKRPICFHSESLKIPFWRNEKRKARFPRPARWVPARARRRAGGAGTAPRPSPAPPGPRPRPEARVRGQRPGRAHLHEAHTRGPSAKAQLGAWGRGRGAEISISAAIWRGAGAAAQRAPREGRGECASALTCK